MKQLKPKQQERAEKSRKKKLARRLRNKDVKRDTEPPETGLAPRWMRRKAALKGTSYWRGDRNVLVNYCGHDYMGGI